MFFFTEPIGIANSTTMTRHGTAQSGVTVDSASTTGSSDDIRIEALVGVSFTNHNEVSSVTYHQNVNGFEGTTNSAIGGSTTDSGSITQPSTTEAGTTTLSQVTFHSAETTYSHSSSTLVSAFDTKAKRSITKSVTLSVQGFSSVSTFLTAALLTSTTVAVALPLPPHGLAIRAYAETDQGEVLLIYNGRPGVVFEGNAFNTATSFSTIIPGPLGNGAVTGLPSATTTSSRVIQNPANGLTWNAILTLGAGGLPKVQGEFATGSIVNGTGQKPASITGAFTTSANRMAELTKVTTAGGLSYDDSFLATIPDGNNWDSTSQSTITIVSTSQDFIFEITAPLGQVGARMRSIVTSVTSTATIPALVPRSAIQSFSSTATSSNTQTTINTAGSTVTTTINVSVDSEFGQSVTYSTFVGAYLTLEPIGTQISPAGRIMALPKGGWQALAKAGVDLPLFLEKPDNVLAPEIGMWGGALVATESNAKMSTTPVQLSRQVRFDAEGPDDPVFVLGAPVLRSYASEIDRSPWGGVMAQASGQGATVGNMYFGFITSNRTVSRTGRDASNKFVFEPLTVSSAESVFVESFPGQLNGEFVRTMALHQNFIS